MEQRKIDRINELARKSRIAPLTPLEKAEQEELRLEYRAMFKSNFVKTLDNVYVVDEKGNKTKALKRNNEAD